MEEEDKPQGRRKGSKANRKYSDQSIQVDQDPTDVKEFEAFEYLSDRKASINKYVLKSEGTISNYKLYEIVTTKGGHTGKTNRRFKDFEWLYNHLVLQYYGRVIPSLPEKNLKTTFNLEGEGYQNERMRLLERNLNLLLKKKHFCRSVVLHNFLTLSCTDFRMFQSGRKSLIEGEEYMKISLYEEVRETLKSKVLNK